MARLPTLPEMVDVSEVTEALGVSRQSASALARTPSFPRPILELKSGTIWTQAALDRFAETSARRPGSPVTASPRPRATGARAST